MVGAECPQWLTAPRPQETALPTASRAVVPATPEITAAQAVPRAVPGTDAQLLQAAAPATAAAEVTEVAGSHGIRDLCDTITALLVRQQRSQTTSQPEQ